MQNPSHLKNIYQVQAGAKLTGNSRSLRIRQVDFIFYGIVYLKQNKFFFSEFIGHRLEYRLIIIKNALTDG